MKNLPKRYEHYIASFVCQGFYIKPTGSRETDSGYTDESDYDFVVYGPEKKLAHALTMSAEWEQGGSGNGLEFASFKLFETNDEDRPINLILVDSKDIFNKYVAATELIKVMDCKTKEERIMVFDSIFGKVEGGLPF